MVEPRLELTSTSGLIYRIREGETKKSSCVVMLYGLGGDENSMWVLESALPVGLSVVTPRALFPIAERNFSWVDDNLSGWPTKQDFMPSVKALVKLIQELEIGIGVQRQELILMGFSQGAALAFSAASDPAITPRAVIAAAAFLPEGDFSGIKGIPVFWGHGRQDEWIPIERARQDSKLLSDYGAATHFCETDVGHKMGMECLKGLKGWLERLE